MSFQDFSFLASCTCIYSAVQTINVFKLQRKELPVEINVVYFFFLIAAYTIYADHNHVTVLCFD